MMTPENRSAANGHSAQASNLANFHSQQKPLLPASQRGFVVPTSVHSANPVRPVTQSMRQLNTEFPAAHSRNFASHHLALPGQAPNLNLNRTQPMLNSSSVIFSTSQRENKLDADHALSENHSSDGKSFRTIDNSYGLTVRVKDRAEKDSQAYWSEQRRPSQESLSLFEKKNQPTEISDRQNFDDYQKLFESRVVNVDGSLRESSILNRSNIYNTMTRNFNESQKSINIEFKSPFEKDPYFHSIDNFSDSQAKQSNPNVASRDSLHQSVELAALKPTILLSPPKTSAPSLNVQPKAKVLEVPGVGVYKGELRNGRMTGEGQLESLEGKVLYEGGFLNNHFHGLGILHATPDETKTLFEQESANTEEDEEHGNSRDLSKNWTRYEGTFQESRRNGHGYLYFANGDFFLGEFEDDKASGFGSYVRTNGTVVNGIWADDHLIEK